MIDFIKEKFNEIYSADPDQIYFAPARVNLIGEHIDYNGGLVMPAALETGTYLALKERTDAEMHFYSVNFPDNQFVYNLEDAPFDKNESYWVNYPVGVINALMEKGTSFDKGYDFLYYGNIPNGGGLSSSASIEVVTAYALNHAQLSKVDLALLSQDVENNFVGVNCGIMDQFSVAMGKKDHAIILDCETLEYDYAPFVLSDHQLVIINTNKERKLAESKYNERRATCEESLEILNQQGEEFANLCNIPYSYFEKHQDKLTEEQRKRVKHVITEQARVLKSKEALAKNDILEFGKLMNASHASLKGDYEVTGKELDTVNEESLKLPYVIGCRMTGAGFGGCAIAIVEKGKVDEYKKALEKSYTEIIGYAPTVIEMSIGDGVRVLSS
ncbi:galactokinase [Flavobacteriaceae bacterium Ap0902]|nr:galactokinase [Flavobacteriaceae bacterium Ap0902]